MGKDWWLGNWGSQAELKGFLHGRCWGEFRGSPGAREQQVLGGKLRHISERHSYPMQHNSPFSSDRYGYSLILLNWKEFIRPNPGKGEGGRERGKDRKCI